MASCKCQAASNTNDIHTLVNGVVGVMHKRLDFDRGLVMLADRERTRLTYTAGFGYRAHR